MAWSVVDPGAAGYTIYDIGGVAPSDLWAANDGGQILHFDGQSWSFVAGGNLPGLYAVFARSASEVYIGGASQQLYLMDSSTLTQQQLYYGAYVSFWSLWGTSGQSLWVATDGTDSVQFWDGTQFHGTSTNGVPGVRFHRVWGTAQNDVWAVGNAGNIVHYDGTTWTVSNTPITTDLTWVSGTGKNDVWAIGPSDIVHWNGASWQTVLAATTPGSTPSGPRAAPRSGPSAHADRSCTVRPPAFRPCPAEPASFSTRYGAPRRRTCGPEERRAFSFTTARPCRAAVAPTPVQATMRHRACLRGRAASARRSPVAIRSCAG